MEKDNDIFREEYDDSRLRTDSKPLPEEEEYKYDFKEEEERYVSSKPYRYTTRARIVK